MGKTQENLKASEDFIRTILKKNFSQNVKSAELKSAAEKLCEAVPGKKKEPGKQKVAA